MNKHEAYVNEKTMYAYQKYLRGEYFEKARAIILKEGKVAFIKDLSNGKVTVPGGGVDDGESIEQAAVREALEETNIVVKPIMPVGKEFYDVDMQIGDVDFKSSRVAYAYLCEFVEKKEGKLGLEGEYAGKTEIFFDDIDKLKDCNISEDAIARIEKYLEMVKQGDKKETLS